MNLTYNQFQTPLGDLTIVASSQKIYALLIDPSFDEAQLELRQMFPTAQLTHSDHPLQDQALAHIFQNQPKPPLALQGSIFQMNVWQATAKISSGHTVSYKQIAENINHPRAYRAVGTALKINRIALLIPCHRILPADGRVGSFRWGQERKVQILNWEKLHLAS